jgi:4-hydroxymandelate oxidase
VLVDRPILWVLCIAGEQGRTDVLEILRRELDEAMVLHGCTNLSHVGRWLLAP